MRLGFDPLSSKRLVQALCGTAESCLSLRCQGLTWVAGLRCSKKKRERERRDTSAVDVVIFLLSRRKTATSNNKPTSTGRASGGGKKKAILYFVDPWIFFFTPEFSFVLLLLFVFFFKKNKIKQSDQHASSNFTSRHTWSSDQPCFSVRCAAWSRLEFHVFLNRKKKTQRSVSKSIRKCIVSGAANVLAYGLLQLVFSSIKQGTPRNIYAAERVMGFHCIGDGWSENAEKRWRIQSLCERK